MSDLKSNLKNMLDKQKKCNDINKRKGCNS